MKFHEGQTLRRKDKHNIKVHVSRIVGGKVLCMCNDGYPRTFRKEVLEKHYEEDE